MDRVAAAWLQAFFDSEGTMRFERQARGGYNRTISACSTDPELIDQAGEMLSRVGIDYSLGYYEPGKDRPYYRIDLHGKLNFQRFLARVGSCVPRKLDVMARIVESYEWSNLGRQRNPNGRRGKS